MSQKFHRCSIQCIIPPYMTDHMAESPDPEIRRRACANLAAAASMRATRNLTRAMPFLMANSSPEAKKNRLIYDAGNTDQLPGQLVRSEGDPKTKDTAANEAYDFAGATYDFYSKVFERNSLDDNGMTLISSVHVSDENGDALNNAFWNGEQMAYGDGDGVIFTRFTRSLDVVGHELTHGVQSFTSNLQYSGQSGALNEHFSDVFGILVRQWKNGESAENANWLIGSEVLITAPTRRAIRDMENPGTAFTNDPFIGTDPQPGDMSNLYTGVRDHGGVHVNSGIPNRVFVLIAKDLGGNAWETAGHIWYETLLGLKTNSVFQDFAQKSYDVASATKYGAAAKKAVKAAWKKVGISL